LLRESLWEFTVRTLFVFFPEVKFASSSLDEESNSSQINQKQQIKDKPSVEICQLGTDDKSLSLPNERAICIQRFSKNCNNGGLITKTMHT
jgi:hypothetical protein